MTSEARNSPTRGEETSSPQEGWQRLISWYLSRSKKSRYLELALVALAEIPEADAEGEFPLDWTQ